MSEAQGRLRRNVFSSVLQVVGTGLILLLTYRLVIVELGTEALGLWSVILASVSVARVGEAGLAGSMVRHVSGGLARGAQREVSQLIQTVLLTVAALALLLSLPFFLLVESVLPLFLEESQWADGYRLLPWALASLILTATASVPLSSLDGAQRYDLRSVLMLASYVLNLLLVLAFLPAEGLLALAWAQLAQSLFLLFGAWWCLRRQLDGLPVLPLCWRWKRLKSILGYSFNLQLISIIQLLFEPLTKLLLTRYAGVSATAYFEVANRAIGMIRSILISANRVTVALSADMQERRAGLIASLYQQNMRVVLSAMFVLYSATLLGLPLLSLAVFSELNTHFLLVALLVMLGTAVNVISAPAYFIFMGIGYLRWNVLAHLLMATSNLLLGFLLGLTLGGRGVLLAWMLSLALGSLLQFRAFLLRYQLGWTAVPCRDLLQPWLLCPLIGVGGFAVILALASAHPWGVSIGVPLLLGLLLLAVVLRNDALRSLLFRSKSERPHA